MATKRKKICIVTGGHFSAASGGAQFQTKCIVESLVKSNKFDIHYFARDVNPHYQAVGYQLVQIAKPVGIRKYAFVFDTSKLLKLLKEIEPDVIYQRALQAYTGVIAYYAKKSGCRSVFHLASDHSLIPASIQGFSPIHWLRFIDKRVGEAGIRNVDSIIAQTHVQSTLLERRYGRPATAVIPNFQPVPGDDLEKSASEVRVLWVANFKAFKQPEVFVRLAKDLAFRDNLNFVMVGRPGNLRKYSELHAEIARTPNITYMGEQPIEEVNKQLAAAHIFVNTSSTEGFPNTFIQAWMRKVPTLSLTVNPDNVLTSEEFGYCGRTYSDLRNKLLELADNRPLRETMGAAAQRHALAVHSPKAAEQLIAILDDSANNRAPGSQSS